MNDAPGQLVNQFMRRLRLEQQVPFGTGMNYDDRNDPSGGSDGLMVSSPQQMQRFPGTDEAQQ
jgi:hypothetical protein